MTTTTITPERQRSRLDLRRRPRRGPDDSGRFPSRRDGPDGATLEELVEATMGDLLAGGSASCPICAEPRLTPRGCGGCGSHLS